MNMGPLKDEYLRAATGTTPWVARDTVDFLDTWAIFRVDIEYHVEMLYSSANLERKGPTRAWDLLGSGGLPGLQIAPSRSSLYTLGPKVGTVSLRPEV